MKKIKFIIPMLLVGAFLLVGCKDQEPIVITLPPEEIELPPEEIVVDVDEEKMDMELTFNYNFPSVHAGSQPEDVMIEKAHGSVVYTTQVPETIELPGYDFDGWFKDTIGKDDWVFNIGGDVVTSDRTIYGHYTSQTDGPDDPPDTPTLPIRHLVTFNVNHDGGQNIVRRVFDSFNVVAPEYHRPGHLLTGWYDAADGGDKVDFPVVVKKNMTFYAHYEALKSFDITLHYNYPNAPENKIIQGYEGLKLDKPDDPVRANYDFLGWFLEASTETQWVFATDIVTKGFDLYAKWARAPLPGMYVRISENWASLGAVPGLWTGGSAGVNINGGSAGFMPTGIANEWRLESTPGDYMALKSSIVGTNIYGIRITGFGKTWNQLIVRESTLINTNADNTDSDLYVQRVWRDNSVDEEGNYHTVTIHFDDVGYDVPEVTKEVLNNQKIASIAVPTRAGYYVANYYRDQAYTQLFDLNTPITESMDLYAKWALIEYYDVNYYVDGQLESTQNDVESGSLITPPTLTKAGMTLDGWYLSASLTGAKYDLTTPLSGDLNLYATWREVVSYQVNWYSLGSLVKNETVIEGNKAVAPAVSNPGYRLVGWFIGDENGTAFDPNSVVNTNLDLYAKWEELPNVQNTILYIKINSAMASINGLVLKVGGTTATKVSDDVYQVDALGSPNTYIQWNNNNNGPWMEGQIYNINLSGYGSAWDCLSLNPTSATFQGSADSTNVQYLAFGSL